MAWADASGKRLYIMVSRLSGITRLHLAKISLMFIQFFDCMKNNR